MNETTQIILGLVFLAAVYVLTRFGIAWRMKRACTVIVNDLERQGAIDPDSAVDLPYAKPSYLKIGMRDYRPKALESLVQGGVVGMTGDGKYFLKKGLQDLQHW